MRQNIFWHECCRLVRDLMEEKLYGTDDDVAMLEDELKFHVSELSQRETERLWEYYADLYLEFGAELK